MIRNLGIDTVSISAMTFLTASVIGLFFTDDGITAADALSSNFRTILGCHAFH
jgi:hypothetical protein